MTRDTDARRADALEESLIFVLTQFQPKSTRFSFPNHELRSTRSQAVDIAENAQLDPQWLSLTTTNKPDKTAIKAGQQIPGSQLLSRRIWRIS